MRQAGVLAAAGIVALTEMTGRLAEDHTTARRLAEGLADLRNLSVDLDRVTTNIVFCDIGGNDHPADRLAAKLAAEGVGVLVTGKHRFRAVTHYHITAAGVDDALAVFARVTGGASRASRA
jgi:threonine aldolase